MEVLTLKPVTGRLPTACRGRPFNHGGVPRSGPVRKIHKTPAEDANDVAKQKVTKDESIKQQIVEIHNLQLKIEDIIDKEQNDDEQVEGKIDLDFTHQQDEVKNNDDENKEDFSIAHEKNEVEELIIADEENKEKQLIVADKSNKEEELIIADEENKEGSVEQVEEKGDLQEKLQSLSHQVETLIEEGDNEQNSETKIKRLNAILKLLHYDEKDEDKGEGTGQNVEHVTEEKSAIHKNEDEKDEGNASCSPEKLKEKVNEDEEKDNQELPSGNKEATQEDEQMAGASKEKDAITETEETEDIVIRKIDDRKEKLADFEEKDNQELPSGNKEATQEDEQMAGASKEKDAITETEDIVIRKIDDGKEKLADFDTSQELVIDDATDTATGPHTVTQEEEKEINQSELQLEMEKPLKVEEKETESSKQGDSSDTTPAEEITVDCEKDEFDSDDDIPLTQNVHRLWYVKSSMALETGKEEEEGLFSDTNAEPEGKWGKLNKGDKLKR